MMGDYVVEKPFAIQKCTSCTITEPTMGRKRSFLKVNCCCKVTFNLCTQCKLLWWMHFGSPKPRQLNSDVTQQPRCSGKVLLTVRIDDLIKLSQPDPRQGGWREVEEDNIQKASTCLVLLSIDADIFNCEKKFFPK